MLEATLTLLMRALYHTYLNRDIVGLIQSCGFRVPENGKMNNDIVKLIETILIVSS